MVEDDDAFTREVRVPAPPRTAYRYFVDHFAEWWPRAYTFAGDGLADIRIEGRGGGRCVEVASDGSERVWGTVVDAVAPERLAFRWQITPDRRIEPDASEASLVTVSFLAEDDGATRVVLRHGEFRRHGEDWRAYRDAMASAQGWTWCLALYAEALT
jgi:uncharacterized protein YndB with AHSA1/START domain